MSFLAIQALNKVLKLFLPILRTKAFHSHPSITNFSGRMKIILLPALSDNYMYLIIDTKTKKAAIVDPVEPKKVLKSVKDEDVYLTCILTTHYHYDHAGGNEELARARPDIVVYGGDTRINGLTHMVSDGELFKIGSLNVKCISTACHTKGDICYYVSDSENPTDRALFTGDTLFFGACGKFFEGDPQKMYNALVKLSILPDNTRVYCGHEYTITSLKFAKSIEPNNIVVKDTLQWAMETRSKNLPTIPSTIELEKKLNPFMRVHEPDIMKCTKSNDPVKVMGILRDMKNHFRAKYD